MLHEAVLAVMLVVSAFLAVYFEEAVYAVASFGIMLILLSVLYFSLNAVFAAVFQLAIGIGTIAVLFLAGEMLKRKTGSEMTVKRGILGLMIALLISIPSLLDFGTLYSPSESAGLTFQEALWHFRSIDIIAQGILILTVALGVAVVLKRERRRR